MTALIIFFGLLFAGLPIVATILAGAVAFMATNDLSVLFDSIPIQFYGALEINSLLAIPLFLLVGECPRRSKSEPPCRSNIEPGLVADQRVVSCG